MPTTLYRVDGTEQPCALLRKVSSFGFDELDFAFPPPRFWADQPATPPAANLRVDERRASALPSPADLLTQVPATDTWLRMTRRSLARLQAWFLLAEDPQRRLEAQPVATLAHQASLVRHVLDEPNLNRVLIADEVGLGKTVEAGLILKHLLALQPGLRVLYLAPARLVANVRREFDRLGLNFRMWVASQDRDATLNDNRVLASIHRAAHDSNLQQFADAPAWDVIVVDECHHLSDWSVGGGSPRRKYKLVDELQQRLPPGGRLLLLSGTPHQGHGPRFDNLLALLRNPKEDLEAIRGRVIYRIKDDITDWDNNPLFPKRQVNEPLVLDLGAAHAKWLEHIHDLFEPGHTYVGGNSAARRRAAGWRCGQALQWATSSIQAGIGYLVRQAIRVGWDLNKPGLSDAVGALRPYRRGPSDEPLQALFARMSKEVGRQLDAGDVEDLEELEEGAAAGWKPDPELLRSVLDEGVALLASTGDRKWRGIYDKLLGSAGDEKVVLFAQPIETVTALSQFLERETGKRPALIIGNQEESERTKEIEAFWKPDGPQFLVSSRAGGEGLNLQIARRLVHVDVPWNPMEMEQRVGRVHRFMSKRTIIVDTVVVKDSREVDTYEVARRKLREVASTMVEPERFEALYSRVMALVPPEELQDVLAERPLGPLNDAERQRVAELVAQGFARWRDFHDKYSDQQRQIRALDAGQARWEDLAAFATAAMGAKPAEGFTSLRFRWADGEVHEASESATVLDTDGEFFASGDYGGMPISREGDNAKAAMLGLNLPKVAAAVRAAAFPEEDTGAAHLRWPTGRPLPIDGLVRPFGVLALARQSVRFDTATPSDAGVSLRVYVVIPAATTDISGAPGAALVRGLQAASARTDPQPDAAMVERLRTEEVRLTQALMVPSDKDRDARVAHAVVPLLAAIVE